MLQESLLQGTMQRTLDISWSAGVRAMMVHAIDDKAITCESTLSGFTEAAIASDLMHDMPENRSFARVRGW